MPTDYYLLPIIMPPTHDQQGNVNKQEGILHKALAKGLLSVNLLSKVHSSSILQWTVCVLFQIDDEE